MAAASSTSGFFQTIPVLPPQFTAHGNSIAASDDKILARLLHIYLPSDTLHISQHLHHLARRSLDPRVLAYTTDAETNPPVLRPLTTFGEENKTDPLWTTAGWQRLKEIGYEEGHVAVSYDESQTRYNRRIYSFAIGHIWACTASMTGCPMSMTDGAATLLKKHLQAKDETQPGRDQVFREAYRRLTSRDPAIAWTSGQWMTERSGGSDVSGTETVAARMSPAEIAELAKTGTDVDAVGLPLGPWKIDGFKWFSSATDSDMSVLLARTAKGISAFMAPMRRRASTPVSPDAAQTELNGIRMQRLKNKLGTKSLPTAELELKGTRAWLIGAEGQGIKEISAILNITRLHSAAHSVAGWSRGLAVCRAYAKVRRVRQTLLQDNPVHLHWMSNETVKYWAATHFCFFGVALLGATEQRYEEMVAGTRAERLIPSNKAHATVLLRLLTPVIKARVSVASVHSLRECIESLGGVGYCENNEQGGTMNLARIYRDIFVNPIWEGTVSVMVEDFVRVLVDQRLGDGNVLENVFAVWVRGVLDSCSNRTFEVEIKTVKERLQALSRAVEIATRETLLICCRHPGGLLELVEFIVCSSLLLYDATVNPSPVAEEAARRWMRLNFHGLLLRQAQEQQDDVSLDQAVFLGTEDAQVWNAPRL